MPRSRRRAAVLVRAAALTSALVLGASLSACSAAVSVDPAPDAADPACAPEMIAMPDTLGDAALRTTTSQATAAWGDPSAVILRCGVPAPGPTTDRCVTVNGVDWVIKDLTTASASPTPSSSAASPAPSASASAGTGPTPSGDATEGPNDTYLLTTFGRTPATELVIDTSKISSATVLATVASAVAKVPQTKKCVGESEVAQLPQGG
ncbi:DUF3515 family protein [Sinomonas terrae]|uniref:DUF3515 domain-containing protein n=1 Tax=Sinomonas terrae TaxID=2908838 RepID=A0ABS9TZQ9_9MICC|nr:DUF3515 family protein [Sinomonas terrae]MCH6469914.1 DUF3515 domain-containing protein [Sinomonas terrae]